MECSSSESTEESTSKICILMANGDSTCCTIFSSITPPCYHRVLHFGSTSDALKALRAEKARLDVVLMDVQMPDMNRLELLKHVEKEFQLPATVVSAGEIEEIVPGGFDHGLSLYFAKPLSHSSMQSLWKNVLAIRKSSLSTRVTYGNEKSEKEPHQKFQLKVLWEDGSDSSSGKRQRFIWTEELHKKFLESIKKLEHERILPRKLVELMDVPGLTKQKISSHLQRYRKQFQQGKQFITSSSSDSYYQANINLASPKSLRCSENLRAALSFSGSEQGNIRPQHQQSAFSAYRIRQSSDNGSNVGTKRHITANNFAPMTCVDYQGCPVEGNFRTDAGYDGNCCSGIENVLSPANTNMLTNCTIISSSSQVAPPLAGGRELLMRGQAMDMSQSADVRRNIPSTFTYSPAFPLEHGSVYLSALSHLMGSDDIPVQPMDDNKFNTLYADFSELIHQ